MKGKYIKFALLIALVCTNVFTIAQTPYKHLPNTSVLLDTADLSSKMTLGISNYLDKAISNSVNNRARHWNRDFSDLNAYENSILSQRKKLSQIIGIVDSLLPQTELEYVSTTSKPSLIAENEYFSVYEVRWHVFAEIYGEGLLLQPKGKVKSRVIAIPDADQTPESLIGLVSTLPVELQYARRLAENGCQVIVPVIVNRSEIGSGSARLNRYTNQPHREWIYRQAYTFGRHIIGYEVQKILALLNWFELQNKNLDAPIGLSGWGEGALLSFYTAALDKRVDVCMISGYFAKREKLWTEPIYRNLFGLLQEFGDAEIASLITPRSLIIEYSASPEISGPPAALPGANIRLRASAAPGKISTALFSDVESEFKRAQNLVGLYKSSLHFIHNQGKPVKALNENSLHLFLKQLNPDTKTLVPKAKLALSAGYILDYQDRQLRQLAQLEQHAQSLIESSRHVRDEFFWSKTSITSPEAWTDSMKTFQNYFWDKVIGRIPETEIPLNPKSRKIIDEVNWAGYELTVDVMPDVFAWGYLLLPKDLKVDEKRPLIVVQHGGNGLPNDMVDKTNPVYKGLATQLVERGYIVFSMHFPWRQGHQYRDIQRKANPLGLSVFSFILNQHERILDWLSLQPWVDSNRIGLYGLSWGGKVAMRVPALLNRYALSVASGDFNEWIWKNATSDWSNSYMFAPEYEMFDFNLGRTFNYGEMAALIAPRAFMVERGHDDGVGIDEWVAFEYAKVNRLYNKLKIPEQTRIEYFDGGHEIHAQGTLEFIKQHFNWPLND